MKNFSFSFFSVKRIWSMRTLELYVMAASELWKFDANALNGSNNDQKRITKLHQTIFIFYLHF